MQTSVHKAREAVVVPEVALGDDRYLAGEAVIELRPASLVSCVMTLSSLSDCIVRRIDYFCGVSTPVNYKRDNFKLRWSLGDKLHYGVVE